MLWEGSAFHALRLGWLLPCGGKGQLYALTRLVMASAMWKEGSACHALRAGLASATGGGGEVSIFCCQVGLASAMWQEG